MKETKLNVAFNYSEHQVDFALIGRTAEDSFCIQLISNKPYPTIKSMDHADPANTNIELEVKSALTHESTVFMTSPQLILLKKAIDKAVAELQID